MFVASWFVNKSNKLLLASWPNEDNAVVYQVGSGDSHCISELGVSVLGILQEGAFSEAAILERLFPNEEPSEKLQAYLRTNLLIHFEQLGLIEKTLS